MKIMVIILHEAQFNPLKVQLNPIYHLLALLGAHPIIHVSRLRVKCQITYKWFSLAFIFVN
jgi:hypothetical protein